MRKIINLIFIYMKNHNSTKEASSSCNAKFYFSISFLLKISKSSTSSSFSIKKYAFLIIKILIKLFTILLPNLANHLF